MSHVKKYLSGISLSVGIAVVAFLINMLVPSGFLGETLLALLLGMLLNPLLGRYEAFNPGINWTSKKILRAGIILAGITLSFTQVIKAGKYALILLLFTFVTAFGVGFICKKAFKINWKLASLLSISTSICGGTAVATVGPTIYAKDRDIAYAISATFIFDIITVIAFPWIGKLLGLSDTSYGLWIGTAVNDTSSVVAAGYAFSDAAGSLATIVKLTRTLFIVPIVLIFAWIYAKKEAPTKTAEKVSIRKIFPWFILGFLAVVGIRSTGIVPENVVTGVSFLSKFFLSMALASIGLKTSLKEVAGVGAKPMIAGVIIDISVVIVALFAQAGIQQFIK
ncbi:MAG: putative sulfate exporter family transporter [Eubacteriales bacterium]|nr:putative sulfate exporter family transporter [Eubacteriales bacterium]MDD4474900.1 putative sulfate exporter family transporter [Eubacteriales bacterium]